MGIPTLQEESSYGIAHSPPLPKLSKLKCSNSPALSSWASRKSPQTQTQVGSGTKKSEKSAEKSPKNRFSVGLEKKNAWKIRLPEKSVENRLYRRFLAEKSETAEKSVEKS